MDKYYRENRRSHSLLTRYTGSYSIDGGAPVDEPSWMFDSHRVINVSDWRRTQAQIPGWRKRIALRTGAFTTLSGVKTTIQYAPGNCYTVARNFDNSARYYVNTDGNMFIGLNTGNTVDDTDIYNEAVTQAVLLFVKKARKVQTAFSGASFLAELRDTVHGILHPAKALRESLTHYRRKTLDRRAWRLTRDEYQYKPGSPVYKRRGYHGFNNREIINRVLRDSWLEYSFGIRPLIGDVEDAFKALRRKRWATSGEAGSKLIFTKSPNVFLSDVAEEVTEGNGTNSFQRWTYKVKRICWVGSQLRGFVHYQVDTNGIRKASQNFGVSWQDILPAIWEVIPYSFLIDYFTNIGDVISALSFANSNLGEVYQTILRAHRVEAYDVKSDSPVNPVLLISEQFNPGSFSYSRRSVIRDRIYELPVPTVQVSVPGVGLKWLNIAALARCRNIDLKTRSIGGLHF